MTKRILVIDDDQYIREIYEEILKKEGYTVEIAVNGEEGLTKLQQGGYDLVLLDKVMPKLDGKGILKALAKNPPQQKNGPLVLLTNANPEAGEEQNDQVALYLVKVDLTPDDLLTEVKKLIEEKK